MKSRVWSVALDADGNEKLRLQVEKVLIAMPDTRKLLLASRPQS